MTVNQQTELRLLDIYDQELTDFTSKFEDFYRQRDKEKMKHFIKNAQHKIDIYNKEVMGFKQKFPSEQSIQHHESNIYYFQGVLKLSSGFYHDMYPGIFSPSYSGELREAIVLFDKSLYSKERSNTRFNKVLIYCELNDRDSAIQELDRILNLYSDNEDVYLRARKKKAELAIPASSGLERLARSVFDKFSGN